MNKNSTRNKSALKSKEGKFSPVDRHHAMLRLDQELPLKTEDWKRVEQSIALLTEFAPNDVINRLLSAIYDYADDQALRAYMLGQEDLVKELRRLAA